MIHLINQSTTVISFSTELLADIPFLSITQILLTATVALIPPLYPQISLFKQRSEKGLATLEQPILVMGDITKGTLEENDEGFEEIVTAISNHYPISGEVKRLNVLRGDADSLESELNTDFGAMVGPNAVVYAEYVEDVDQDMEVVTFHPFDPAQTLKLIEIRRWIRTTTTERSHYATMVTAFSWTGVSLLELL